MLILHHKVDIALYFKKSSKVLFSVHCVILTENYFKLMSPIYAFQSQK